MRITDLPTLLNLNRLKNNQNQDHKKGIQYKTGDIVKGKVLEAQGKALVMMLNSGKMLRLQDMGTSPHQMGDALKMELIKEGDILMGKVIEEPVDTGVKEDLSEAALRKIGLESTEERKTVAKLLRLNGMPVTKENVNLLTEAKKYISRLSDLVKGNIIDAGKLPIDKNVKTILVEHLNKSDQLYEVPKSNDMSTVKDLMAAEVDLTKGAPFIQKDALVAAEKTGIYEFDEKEFTVTKASANAYLSEKLDKVAYKSLVFNLKNNVENTVKNLVLLDKVILGSDSVTQQLDRFAKNIKFIFNKSHITNASHPELIKQLVEFEEISLKDYEAFEKSAQKLIDMLKTEPAMSEIDKAVTSAQVMSIKSSLTYLNDMSQNLVFVQMPVQLNDHVQNMDLYIKKNPNKKKVDPNHCSIFLSLDTENFNTVKTLLELNRDKASVTFKLKDEAMAKYFKDHLEELKDQLKDKGYLNVALNAIEYKKDDTYVLDEETSSIEHYIDVKL